MGLLDFLPSWSKSPNRDAKNLNRSISPVNFTRIKHDIASWRDAISEMELAYFPHRVKTQRIYMDTVLNGHVDACMKRRMNLTMLKDFCFYNGEKEDKDSTELFKSKWFYEFMRYSLEANFHGYSLISLGDIENNSFPNLQLVKRENVSPDRLMVGSFIYAINSGIHFMDESQKDDAGQSYYDWTVWVDTPSDKGTSNCGYGILYKIAYYEILLRNLTGFNANYVELYGQPIRWAKTNKLEGDEYDALADAMDQMGESASIITDTQDEITLLESNGTGTGYKSYDNFEKRLEQKISKVILGHSDALDSTPGKLGNQDGEESMAAQALEDIETVDSRFIENVVNDTLIPKLIKIGYPIKQGLVFKFKNDKEKQEIRIQKDKSNAVTAGYVLQLANAGYKPDAKWLSEFMDVPLVEKEQTPATEPLNQEIQAKLKNFYGKV